MSRFHKFGLRQGVYIDQRYGPDTTYRRNQAMIERKELLKNKVIVSGHLKYPAQLVVKNNKSEPYKIHKDYSKIPVPDEVSDDED